MYALTWDGEVHDEEVCDVVELLAADDGHADDEVAGDAAREDQRVQDAEQHLHSFRFCARVS